MKLIAFLRKNSFVLLLLVVFVLSDVLISAWDPMVTSRRFYKNDFTKTLYHHGWQNHGSVFFGNSSVTGAYIENDSKSGLVEMGLSYGKLTDLKAIMEQQLYRFDGPLVIGIDVHTMIDSLETDPTYQWFKPWYQPYVYTYRDYFRDTGTEIACGFAQGLVMLDASRLESCARYPETLKLSSAADPLAYAPRWIDKELYFGHETEEELRKNWNNYEQRFGWMSQHDYKGNLEALDWILRYAQEHQLPLRVIWMPWNKSFEPPRYMPDLQEDVNRRLAAYNVPVLDVLQHYDPKYFHDVTHLSREKGAPVFTKEVDAWLFSLAKSSK
jgi:hypothetical protein